MHIDPCLLFAFNRDFRLSFPEKPLVDLQKIELMAMNSSYF